MKKWAISRTNWARFVKKLHIIGHDFSQKVTNCPRTSRIIPGNHTKTHEDTRFLEKGVKSSEIVRNRSQPLTRAPEPLSSLQILVQISRHRGAKGARRAHFEGKLLKVYDLHRKLSRFFAISAKSCAIHRDDYTGNCPKLGKDWAKHEENHAISRTISHEIFARMVREWRFPDLSGTFPDKSRVLGEEKVCFRCDLLVLTS